MDGDPTILRPGGRCDGGRPSTLGQEDGHTREEYHKKLTLLEALAVANGISSVADMLWCGLTTMAMVSTMQLRR